MCRRHCFSLFRRRARPVDLAPVARCIALLSKLALCLLFFAPRLSPATEPAAVSTGSSGWPAAWVRAWSQPGNQLRPLQFVHELAPEHATASDMQLRPLQSGQELAQEQAIASEMQQLKQLGLGGIVCNVAFSNYMVSAANWQTLATSVAACRAVGLRVWLYDEKGYPSGSAGGLVLKDHPELQAMELSYDPSRPDHFVLRPAYEHAHASNNYYAARRAINLLEADATKEFLAKTHEAYWRRLKPYFGGTIQAVFTDEPSLMAVNIGSLGEAVQKSVPVDDPLDPAAKALPSVPWSRDLPRLYQQRYGEDLIPRRQSLFTGDTEADRQVRRQFWALIANLVADRYFGQIQTWSAGHRLVSTGHTLGEEVPLLHVPLEGSALKVLRRMDIPGLDTLSSDPQVARYDGWLAATLPSSAALAEGRRRVMSETSDFSQTHSGHAPVTLPQMQGTAAWQAAFGVTEFALYYKRAARTPQDYRAYTDFVGRLNAVLRDAQWAPDVLLYYPIYDLWAEYRPVAERLTLESQPPSLQKIATSFHRLGQHLTRRQVPFALADHEMLAGAKVRHGGLWLGKHRFNAIVLPDGVALPDPAARVLRQFADQGGQVLRDDLNRLPPFPPPGQSRFDIPRFDPPNASLILGRFARDNREILLVVNTAAAPYSGKLSVPNPDAWYAANPADGRIDRAAARDKALSVILPPYGALLLVSPRN